MSHSSQPHGLQHTRLPCPPQSPQVCSNTCPLCHWYHPSVSSSVAPCFSCPQSFKASGLFPVSLLFASGDQSIGVSASALVLPMNIQGWFPLGLSSLISLLFRVLSGGFPGCSSSEESACNARNLGLILELERSLAEGNGYPFQYSCMENSMVGWWVSLVGYSSCGCRVRHNWET